MLDFGFWILDCATADKNRLSPSPPLSSSPLWVGVGCQRGVSKLAIERAIEWTFANYDLDLATIAGLATIDSKAEELGLVDYCLKKGWFLKIYPPGWLNSVAVAHPSTSVAAAVGSKSVAEAAALCAAQTDILLVPKQKFRLDVDSGWVTIAVAHSSATLTARSKKR
jgi:cobalamin biosynthesis protein CbiG